MYTYVYDHTTTVARESRLSALVIEAVSAVYIYSKLSHTHKQQISREGGPQPQILVRLKCEKGKPEWTTDTLHSAGSPASWHWTQVTPMWVANSVEATTLIYTTIHQMIVELSQKLNVCLMMMILRVTSENANPSC